jgi:SNF2 family DNA or RNA helicase
MILAIFGDDALKARLRGMPMQKLTPKASVSAIHAGALHTKLLQIASGAVYEGSGKYHVIDPGRYEMTLDLVEQREHSLVIFFWKHQRDQLIAEASKRGITYAVLDGETPEKERNAIVERYQLGAYRTIFGHPKAVAHGLTMTRGTATIWPCPTYDLEWFKQGSKRQHRIGQTQKTETIIVVAEDTHEEFVYKRLFDKNARMTNLLDLFASL